MNATEFLRRLRRLARRNNTTVRVDPGRGKGGHVMVYYGARRTILATGHRRDIPRGTLRVMCGDLGIEPNDL